MMKPKKKSHSQKLMHGKRLDPAQRFMLLLEIEKTKHSYGEIAKIFGLTRQAVSSFASRNGLRRAKK